jgi:hypothetical protein
METRLVCHHEAQTSVWSCSMNLSSLLARFCLVQTPVSAHWKCPMCSSMHETSYLLKFRGNPALVGWTSPLGSEMARFGDWKLTIFAPIAMRSVDLQNLRWIGMAAVGQIFYQRITWVMPPSGERGHLDRLGPQDLICSLTLKIHGSTCIWNSVLRIFSSWHFMAVCSHGGMLAAEKCTVVTVERDTLAR